MTMNPPNGPSYHWIADVGAGTTMVFLMIDADGRQGGSSDILTVASSSESSCLDAQSPTSTASPSASGAPPPVVPETGNSKVSMGAIAGTALAALVALVRPLLISVPLASYTGAFCRLFWLLLVSISSRNGEMIDVRFMMLVDSPQVDVIHSGLGLQTT